MNQKQPNQLFTCTFHGSAQSLWTTISGYDQTLSGNSITYQSPHPNVKKGLITRAKEGFLSIRWQSAVVPDNIEGMLQLVLLIGMGGPQWAPHAFHLEVNHQLLFTFSTYTNGTSSNWLRKHENGAELEFRKLYQDVHQDVFGYLLLRLPSTGYTRGEPLHLALKTEDAQSNDWIIVFEHRIGKRPFFQVEPLLKHEEHHLVQLVRMVVDALEDQQLYILTPQKEMHFSLSIGIHTFEIPIPAVETVSEENIILNYADQTTETVSLRLTPLRQRTVYILPYSHNDIGYTHHQFEVEKRQWQHIEQAVELWEQTRSRPNGESSKWNLEVLWALDTWLQSTTRPWKNRFWRAVQEGGIGLNALYANFLTGMASEQELYHFIQFAKELCDQHPIQIDTAVMTDIPGCNWGLVKVLAENGIRFFLSAPNEFDRVGNIYQQGDQPFYWLDPTQQYKILFWIAGASYSLFHRGPLSKMGVERMLEYLRTLETNQYPYDMVALPYTIGGDNGPPDPTLSDFVAEWNRHYVSPTLRIATVTEFFHDFEKQYGKTLPTQWGDLTPYWEDGVGSTARETAMVRNAVDLLVQAEALQTYHFKKNSPTKQIQRVWHQILLYDEHTWGAYNSVSEPDLPEVKAQWHTKQRFAIQAYQGATKLLDRTLQKLYRHFGKESDGIVVNSLPWEESGWVTIPNQPHWKSIFLLNTKQLLPIYHDDPFARVYIPKLLPWEISGFEGRAEMVEPLSFPQLKRSAYHIENEFLRLEVNPLSGAIQSLVTLNDGKEWVQPQSQYGVGEFLTILGKFPNQAQRLSKVHIQTSVHAAKAQITIQAQAPTCDHFQACYRLYPYQDFFEMEIKFVKKPLRAKEAMHIAFPFQVEGGVVRYDVPFGFVQPEVNQLKGSNKNFFCAQSWFDVSNDTVGLCCVMLDSFLIETEDMIAEIGWRPFALDKPPVFAYLLNNYWHTNYKADQEGLIRFRFMIKPHLTFSYEENVRFALQMKQSIVSFAKEFNESIHSNSI
ncbi:MAG: hypothetical protein N2450_06445 [bacterium]|nr:hypothetical protein [bacterium]